MDKWQTLQIAKELQEKDIKCVNTQVLKEYNLSLNETIKVFHKLIELEQYEQDLIDNPEDEEDQGDNNWRLRSGDLE